MTAHKYDLFSVDNHVVEPADVKWKMAAASLLDEPEIAAWRATLASNPYAAMDLPAPRMKGIRHAGHVELHAGDPCPDISIGTNMYERCGLPMDTVRGAAPPATRAPWPALPLEVTTKRRVGRALEASLARGPGGYEMSIITFLTRTNSSSPPRPPSRPYPLSFTPPVAKFPVVTSELLSAGYIIYRI